MLRKFENLILLVLCLMLTNACAEKKEFMKKDGLYGEIKTNKGDIVVDLHYKETPLTVTNFVGLAEGTKESNKGKGTPFYDGIIFHRVIKDFMVQTGDPEGTGRGGPGYRFSDEFVDGLTHERGVLSMANSGPGTNGSQFFITQVSTPHLNGRHTVFGKVVEGMDVVDAIANAKTVSGDRPTEDIVIETIKIHRVGADAKSFKADETSLEQQLSEIERKKERQVSEKKKREEKDLKKFISETEEQHGAKFQTTASGLKYLVITEGSGSDPKKGETVSAHYTGTFIDGRKFDSSRDRDQAFQFPVGSGRVIKAWDEAFETMKKGERRILIAPSDLAYGSNGIGPIPPNATLIFDVERL